VTPDGSNPSRCTDKAHENGEAYALRQAVSAAQELAANLRSRTQ
jgi:hypothetical protein